MAKRSPCIFSLFGIFRLGGIAVQVNPIYLEREIEHVLTDSGFSISLF